MRMQGVLSVRRLALLCAAFLASCGGGEQITLAGRIYGLAPGSSVELQIADGTSTRAVQAGPNGSIPVAFSMGREFQRGTPYVLEISRHPRGQLCHVVLNGAGVLKSAQREVEVDCHRTFLNDTGIWSADPALNNSAAVQPDAGFGRDAESDRLAKVGAGLVGFDYTRLCASGHPVDLAGDCPTDTPFGFANAWSCTRDNLTGLVWSIEAIEYDPALGVPADGLCGQSSWRAPSTRELLSLVHVGKSDPAEAAIDLGAFPETPAQAFRAQDIYGDGDGAHWIVHFGQRGSAGKQTLGAVLFQRWVAAGDESRLADTLSEEYRRVDTGDGWVLTDMARDLMWWMPRTSGFMEWSAAVATAGRANTAKAGGYSGWRLPNRAELESLVKRTASQPALDPAVYGADTTSFSQLFWTASPGLANQGTVTAWVVDFAYGDLSLTPKSSSAKVLLVRNKVLDMAR